MKSGYAFVHFKDDNDAENAIRGLNGHIPSGPEFQGCKLKVQWAKHDRGSHGSSRSNPIPSRTLFVANYDHIHTKNHDIRRHFEPYGKVLNVHRHQNYAFVDFETQENATKALECTHLSTLFGRLIRVEYSSRQDGPSNPRATSPDPARASPFDDSCDGPSNPRAMSPDPPRASPVDDSGEEVASSNLNG